jgi:hypothetical protein
MFQGLLEGSLRRLSAIRTPAGREATGTNFYEISFMDKFHSRSAFSGSSA